MLDVLKRLWNNALQSPSPALTQMRLGPEGSLDNPLMLQFFTWESKHDEMSWWKHFETELPRLAKMGFTQVWLPPPNKGADKNGRGYDAYDLWDLGEFDQKGTVGTRWGTRQELIQACNAAKEQQIDILIDAVLNHKLGADRLETFNAVSVDPQNRLKDIGKPGPIQGWTAFDFAGRGDKYSSLKWTQEHFTGLDWDHRTRKRGVFRISGKGRQGWSRYVDTELGNYDYLLGVDIDHRHPDVQEDLLRWGSWILETTGAAGFRLDAIKHIDRRFTLKFITKVRENSRKPKMFTVSEYWSGNLKMIQPYIRAFRGETAFFDVPLHMNFHSASKQRSRYDLRTIFNGSIVKVRPGDAVTFVDNHDTVEGQSLESWVGDNFKIQAYALILLRSEGYPCVFYGDLYPNTECFNSTISQNLVLVIEVRKRFAYGATEDYFAGRNHIGFVRAGDSQHPGCAVVLSNKEDAGDLVHEIRMKVGVENAGATYRSFMSQHGRVEIDAEGWGVFSCFAGHLQVWVKMDDDMRDNRG